MRKITQEAITAFYKGIPFKKDNTAVHAWSRNITMTLHGNTIAIRNLDTNILKISNGGWSSNTTKERLNALRGVSVVQKNFVWYLNGVEWDGAPIEVQGTRGIQS